MHVSNAVRTAPLLGMLMLLTAACAGNEGGSAAQSPTGGGSQKLTVYSGRSESLIGELVTQFEKDSGIDVEVRYGDTTDLANTLMEEGERSPADVFFAQDAGSLGALQNANRLGAIEAGVLDRVDRRFRSEAGMWVGTSGRVRVLAHNPDMVEKGDLPSSVDALTSREWRSKVGWAPKNSSFQAFVTAFRVMRGEEEAERWLRAMKDNGAKTFESNDAIAEAVGEGEIPVGLVNHYYPYEVREEHPDAKVEAHFFSGGDVGGLVNVAGVGILKSSKNLQNAQRFVDYLLSQPAQTYFVEKTWEYPLIQGVEPTSGLPQLSSLEPPPIELSRLDDLEGTLRLLQKVGLL